MLSKPTNAPNMFLDFDLSLTSIDRHGTQVPPPSFPFPPPFFPLPPAQQKTHNLQVSWIVEDIFGTGTWDWR